MWPETKNAVRDALWSCETLMSLSKDDSQKLRDVTANIKHPTRKEIKDKIQSNSFVENIDFLIDEKIIEELKLLYAEAAISINLDPDYGIALLTYISILKELEDE